MERSNSSFFFCVLPISHNHDDDNGNVIKIFPKEIFGSDEPVSEEELLIMEYNRT